MGDKNIFGPDVDGDCCGCSMCESEVPECNCENCNYESSASGPGDHSGEWSMTRCYTGIYYSFDRYITADQLTVDGEIVAGCDPIQNYDEFDTVDGSKYLDDDLSNCDPQWDVEGSCGTGYNSEWDLTYGGYCANDDQP